MPKLFLSNKQADAVLSMPLKKLTNLERKQIDADMEELIAKKKYLSNLLNQRSLLLETLIKELTLLKKNFNTKRKTKILKDVNILNRANHFPNELSGGEQQRVAIARALISETDLILADEPTGNLDSENSLMISKILFNYVREEGSSLIIVTHDTKLANKTDRKIKIKDGKIN